MKLKVFSGKKTKHKWEKMTKKMTKSKKMYEIFKSFLKIGLKILRFRRKKFL